MKVSVLIVDDEKEFADVLAERLQIKGYRAQACYSGREALQRIRDDGIDVVAAERALQRVRGHLARAIEDTRFHGAQVVVEVGAAARDRCRAYEHRHNECGPRC